MSQTTKTVVVTIAALALAATFAACAPAAQNLEPTSSPTAPTVPDAPTSSSATETAEQTMVSTPTCGPERGRFQISAPDSNGPYTVTMLGPLIDYGPAAYASGTVERDENGTILSYTIAEGDTAYGIEDRFCYDVILMNNNVDFWDIHPGDVLSLRPNPDWKKPETP